MIRTKENFIAFKTMFVMGIIRFMRAWVQTILPPVITATLTFIVFGRLIGSRIGMMSGVPYIQYIAPGLIMMWVIIDAYNNVVGAIFLAKFQRNIEEILVSPIPNYVMLLGFLSTGIARGFVTGSLISIMALLFTHLPIHHVVVTFLIVFLSALLFGLVAFINGLYAKSFDDIMIVPTFILMPLTYFGGVFYSIKMLPPTLQKLSLANPIFYIIEVFRYGVLGIADINIYFAFLMVITFIIILFSICLYLLNQGVGLRS